VCDGSHGPPFTACDKPPSVESPAAIRKKATVRPAVAVDIGVKHENFFVAKFPDSESAKRASQPLQRLTTRASAC
jgi:hypothetical protein